MHAEVALARIMRAFQETVGSTLRRGPGDVPLELMNRPHFTVILKSDTGTRFSYDANNLTYGIQDGEFVVSFVSSGFIRTVSAALIDKIDFDYRYDNRGGDYCGQCDQPIGHFSLG
jgi:hypothetical protein